VADWVSWKKVVCSPPEQEWQMVIWSCGVFVLMAMWCFVSRLNYDVSCSGGLRDIMKEQCLKASMTLPYVLPFQKQSCN